MAPLSAEKKDEIRELVLDYFADECDVDRESLTDSTDIVEQLEGDSLMLLSLLEQVRKRYGLSIELKTLGKHLMRRPANTVGQVVELTCLVVEHGNDILSVEL